jgi:hypothetical protein
VAPLVPVVIGCVGVVVEAAGLLLSADPHATQESKTISLLKNSHVHCTFVYGWV